jgi:hypothetical protein
MATRGRRSAVFLLISYVKYNLPTDVSGEEPDPEDLDDLELQAQIREYEEELALADFQDIPAEDLFDDGFDIEEDMMDTS